MTILCKSNGKGWYALGFWGVLFLLDKRSDQTGATSPKLVETSVWSPGKRTTSWVKDWNSMSHRSLDGGFTLHQQLRPGLWPLEASTRFGQAKGSISRISKATKKSKKGQWLQRKVSSTLSHTHMGMGQYLLIPFLGEWTSIYQLFWCSPGVQGFDTLPHPHFLPIFHVIRHGARPPSGTGAFPFPSPWDSTPVASQELRDPPWSPPRESDGLEIPSGNLTIGKP